MRSRDLERAIDRAFAFLKREVDETGAWPSSFFHLPFSARIPETPPFVAAKGLLSLEGVDHPDAAELRERSRKFLRDEMEPPGLWRYWPTLPPDMDDVALCSIVADPPVAAEDNLALMLSCQTEDELFLTWLQRPEDPESVVNPVDSAVNANILAHLGDRPETRAAQRWLVRLIAKPAATQAQRLAIYYYPYALDLYFALVRASMLKAPLFADQRETLRERIMACLRPDGSFGDCQRTAQSITALHRLGADCSALDGPAAERLREAQRADGGWPECVAFLGYPLHAGFGSESLTTVCCIEALHCILAG